jgi:phage terminase small subunit
MPHDPPRVGQKYPATDQNTGAVLKRVCGLPRFNSDFWRLKLTKQKTTKIGEHMTKISAPSHLRPSTKKWWLSVQSEFALEEHHSKILTLAGEALDRCEQAREALATYGTTYQDRFDSPKARPEVAIERDSRIAFARLLRELALDGVDAPDAPRPARTADYGARR